MPKVSFDDKGWFDTWFPKTKCEYNKWDITLGVSICTHKRMDLVKTLFITFCAIDNPKPFFCPLILEEKGIKTKEDFYNWWIKQQLNI